MNAGDAGDTQAPDRARANTRSDSALRLRGLEVHAGPRRLLGPLDLNLRPGHCLGVVGESGSGKSLTALSMLGLLPAGLRARADLAHGEIAIGFDSPGHAAYAAASSVGCRRIRWRHCIPCATSARN